MYRHLPFNKHFLPFVMALFMGFAGTTMAQTGAPHAFSVSESQQVHFAPGNLQYRASTNTWRFAANPWDYVGSSNSNLSSTYDGWIDLFGWGTSGYNHGASAYQPWSTSTTYSQYYAYGSSSYNLNSQTGQADWGYNPISNGGNQENSGWRTLTIDEWNYVFNTRTTASGIRYAKAKVNGVNGMILLPDDWNSSYYALNTSSSYYSANTISVAQWASLERYGAVFLPAGGQRPGTSVDDVGSYGVYWSASYYNSSYAYDVYFYDGYLNVSDRYYRYIGRSVRLVRPTQNYSYNINAVPSPEEGGTVSGVSACAAGTVCTLTATPSAGYAFTGWTEEGVLVSWDANYTFIALRDRNLVANFSKSYSFSVSTGEQVYFSPGNLQYKASTNTWRFAADPWDYVGSSNSSISSTYDGWIDLFGWGTSGNNHGATSYQPWSTSTSSNQYYAYGSSSYNLNSQTGQADWGYNPISNGGNQENSGWRTLTQAEWYYVFYTRTTASGLRYAKAKVNGVNGMILLPDDWNSSYYTLNTSSSYYSANTISAAQWASLERYGAVFLPAAGYRSGTSVNYVGSYGNYWSASYNNSNNAYDMYFSDGSLSASNSYGRYYGLSVRLVRPAENYSYNININAIPSPAEGGTVSGGGACAAGIDCTLTATANEGYTFAGWMEDGTIVSNTSVYSFCALRDRNLIALFCSEGNIVFEDANVKSICVSQWDTNGDGELSYAEAAAVTNIGTVFQNNTSIHSFSELEYFIGLGSIGNQAFYGCTELTQVTIPTGVATVGNRAFWNCPALQTVYFNAVNCTSMQSSYNSITYSVFSSNSSGGASALTRVVIGNTVTRIPDYAFRGSEDIYQRLVVPASVVEIGQYAFYGCNSMVQMVIQGNGLQTINQYAFYGCSALRSALNLPNSVNYVGNYAFYGCLVLPSLTVGEGVRFIGPYAFWNCPVLTTVNFNAVNCVNMYTYASSTYYAVFNSGTNNGGATPIVTLSIGENVNRIPDYAFRQSTNLTSDIVIPEATTYIGQYAFYGAQSQELTIGEGVASIGGYAFWNCPNLATVHFNATNCTTMNTYSSSTYYAVFNSGTNNGGATPIVTLSIGENVTRIPDYSFRQSTNLTSDIVIPNATTYIGQYAFYGGIQSEKLTIGNGVTAIGQYAFYGAQSWELTIGEGVTSIGGYAFWNCPNLVTVQFNAINCTSMKTGDWYSVFNQGTNNDAPTAIVNLTIGEQVTNVPEFAFRYCNRMTGDLVIPNSVTNIGRYAFANCSGQNVIIGNGVITIADNAFNNSSAFVGTLHLGNAVSSIGECAFDGCTGLTGDLVFPNSVTNIASYAFRDCRGFNGTLTLPVNESYTTISTYTFRGCSGFNGILTIPNNVVSVNSYAFYGCSGFTGVLSLHDAMTSIGSDAFNGCSQITELVIGESVSTIGEYAFYTCSQLSKVTIGEGVRTIGQYAFWNCPVLTTLNFNATNCTTMVTNSQYSVFNSGTSNGGTTPIVHLTIGENVTRIPDYAFRNSPNATGNLLLPNGLTYIGQYAFYENIGFTGDLVIPNAVTNLGQYAFCNCNGFNGSLVLGSGIQTINQYTFSGCTGFSGSLIVGRAVNSIGNYAFQNCHGFIFLISENPTPPTAVNNSFSNMNFTIPVYVPYAMIPDYQNAAGWNQFTYYKEQCVFDRLDNELWSDENNWYAYELPGPEDVVCVNSNCHLDMDANVLHLYVLNLNDVFTINNGQTLSTTYGMGILQPSQLVMEDGSQLVNNLPGLNGTVRKHINGFGTGYDGWFTIAAPIYGGMPVGTLATGSYDLYAYDEPTHYWLNEKVANNDLTALVPGQGYLYASQGERTLSFAGQLVASNAEISVPVTRTLHELPGLNLVGNPYTNSIGISQVKLNGTPITTYYKAVGGTGFMAYTDADDEPIQPGEGFMLMAGEGGTLTFAPSARCEQQDGYVRLVLRRDGQVCDRTYVSMNLGATLSKMALSEDRSLLYFQNGGERYAVAGQRDGAQLRFEPSVSASFVIEASLLNTRVGYLHLIDHLTGDDIDLLAQSCYAFEADPEDAPERFSLAFAPQEMPSGREGGRDLYNNFMLPFHELNVNQNAYYDVFVIVAAPEVTGTGTVTGSGNYPRGATCTLTATAAEGYTFVNWTKGDEVVAETSTFSFVVTDGGTYVAHFYHGFNVTATADPETAGTVTGGGFYENETTCNLIATANSGYNFYCWTKGEGLVISTSANYSFTVTEDGQYVAHFNTGGAMVTHTVAASANFAAGGTVEGAGTYLDNTTCTVSAVPNVGYVFTNWTNGDAVVSTDADYSFTVTENVALVANFTAEAGNIVQTSTLSEGWNWYSTYIDQEDIDGLAQLESGLGENGVLIKSRGSGFVSNFGSFWAGSMTAIDNVSSYLILTDAAAEVTLTGTAASASQYPITLTPGWSWIGYPCASAMSLSTALSSLTPMEGDMLKSREGFSTYDPVQGWLGSLQTLTPGVGLMYLSNNTSEVDLVYPEASKAEPLAENVTARYNYWSPVMHQQPYTMTMTAVVTLDGAEAQSTQYELAAFVNDECRGSAKLQYIAALDRYVAFLTVYGEQTTNLTFGLYDAETGKEYHDTDNILPFVADENVGSPRNPYAINFRGTTGLAEMDSRIQVYPNPVEHGQVFRIGKSEEDLGEVQIEFINALGAVVSKEISTQLPASIKAPETPGVYTVRVTVKGKGTCYGKLVVK